MICSFLFVCVYDWNFSFIIGHASFLFTAEPPDTVDNGFIKREDFLKECAQWFMVPPRNSEKNTRVFSRKFFNIVDPLKHSNNLGRSVSKGLLFTSRPCFLMVVLDD